MTISDDGAEGRGIRGTLVALGVGFLLLVGALAFTAVRGAGDGEEAQLVLTGSSTVAPLASEIARRFEERRPGVRVDVQAGGSSRGIADVRRGLNDIGMISRKLREGEGELQAFPVARDGIALLVHRDNPVEELAPDRVRAVWTGAVEDWSELGGPPGPITVVHKAEGRATLAVFLAHFGLRNSEVTADVVVGANQQAIRTVAGSPGAVGYVSIGEAEIEIEHGAAVRLLPLEGVAPTAENVAAGRFPLRRELNLVTATEPSGLTRAFLEFSRSEAVDPLVRRRGFVPVARE